MTRIIAYCGRVAALVVLVAVLTAACVGRPDVGSDARPVGGTNGAVLLEIGSLL